MEIRRILLALLITSATAALAETVMVKQDFASARLTERDGVVLVEAKVSASGRDKLKFENKEITVDVDQQPRTLKLRGPITGDSIEMGPYSREVAQRIVYLINRRL